MSPSTRRNFLQSAAAASTLAFAQHALPGVTSSHKLSGHVLTRPLAITMWDFSWLERRWPGAGYEDWDAVLDGLVERGYDAIRLDAYPHLLAADPLRTWELLPHWNQQDWGSPALNRVQVQPALNEFLSKCRARGLLVGLSTWFRQDRDDARMRIRSPEDLGRVWVQALATLDDAARDTLLFVDLCNEWPLDVWAPFYPANTPRSSPEGIRWMQAASDVVRDAFPQFSLTFSFTSEYETWRTQNVSMLDFLELHLWMTHFTDFYEQAGYHYERFDSRGYDNLVLNAERLYRERPAHWQTGLIKGVNLLAEWSRVSGKPLITTECWSLVDYKDWPLLPWDWLRDLCEIGVQRASASGCWLAMATSNFCAPQFAGMWTDVAWHRRLTDVIHAGPLPASVAGR